MENFFIIVSSDFFLIFIAFAFIAFAVFLIFVIVLRMVINYLKIRKERLKTADESFVLTRPAAFDALINLKIDETKANELCDVAQELIIKRAKRKNGGSGFSFENKWIVIAGKKIYSYDLLGENHEKSLDNIYDVKEVALILKDIL